MIHTGFGIVIPTKYAARLPESIKHHRELKFIVENQYTAVILQSTAKEFEGDIVCCSFPDHPVNGLVALMSKVNKNEDITTSNTNKNSAKIVISPRGGLTNKRAGR